MDGKDKGTLLVVSGFSQWRPHFETELEVVLQSLKKGRRVIVLECDGSPLFCEGNPRGEMGGCVLCKGRRNAGYKLIEGKIERYSFSEFLDTGDDKIDDQNWNEENLKAWEFDGEKLGEGVFSSLISHYRRENPPFDKREVHGRVRSSKMFYIAVRNAAAKFKPAEILIFNGRFASCRASMFGGRRGYPDADILIHEKGHSRESYSLLRNQRVHDLVPREQFVKEIWEQSSHTEQEKESIAAGFYEERKAGIVSNWRPLTDGQKKGAVPDDVNRGLRNVVVFLSTDDEYAAVGPEWKEGVFDSQLDGCRYLVSLLPEMKTTQLVIRMHPNQKRDPATVQKYHELAEAFPERFCVLPPEDVTDSYSLLNAAGVVVTFGSTLGIEAPYWGVPSILLRAALYRGLGSVYLPGSEEELKNLLIGEIEPLPKRGAVVFGYFKKSFGIPFQYYEADDINAGRFLGTDVKAPWSTYVKRKLCYMLAKVLPSIH